MIKKALLFLLAPLLMLVSVPSAALASVPSRVDNAPVLFVHGYINNPLCTGGDVSGTFASAIAEMQSRGYTGPTASIAYYACDTNGANIQSSGDPNAYFPSGTWTGGWGHHGGNTVNTDTRHISYQLAWYIYDNYSSQGGQTVNLVGHSMGGLIIRWALYQIQAQNPIFPPYLYVQDAVTISTPHRGTNDGWNNITWCPGYTQCQQMLPNSAFLNELDTYGRNPQATGGTEWTAFGSLKCDIMTPAQATDMGDVHKVIYTGAKPKCYNHTNYLTDTSDALDMPVQYRNPGDGAFTTISNGAHSLAWLSNVLMGDHPSSLSPPANPPADNPVNNVLADLQKSLGGLFGN